MTPSYQPNLEFNAGAIKPVECLREAWDIIKGEYWPLFAVSIVGGLIAGFTMYILLGAMICGIFTCYLKKIDGAGPVNFDDLWTGFKYLGPSALATIVFVVPLVTYFIVIFVTMYSPLIVSAAMGKNADPSIILGTFLGALAVDVVVAIVMTCIHSLMIFTFPLIVDRKLSSLDAIKLSARAALKNVGGIAGLIGINFALVLLGQMAFCVGIYFVIPVLTATSLVAYRKVFPKIQQQLHQ
ncbi:MAG: hypothetical protein HOP17_10170 [Acidobacteria bacterium]|nr:hypothetical protein [Acidobacteriota bacterium]